MTTTNSPDVRLVLTESGTEIALAALQGLWTEAMYLRLSAQTNHLIEFSDGALELLPTPTRTHQRILAYLYEQFAAIVHPLGGIVLFAALRLRISPTKYREPDLLLLCDQADPRNQEAFWLGADLVVEVVSPDHPERDLVQKRADYAEAQIPEYWIVDPQTVTITVLVLDGSRYVVHGVFAPGTFATGLLIPHLTLDVAAVFAAGGIQPPYSTT